MIVVVLPPSDSQRRWARAWSSRRASGSRRAWASSTRRARFIEQEKGKGKGQGKEPEKGKGMGQGKGKAGPAQAGKAGPPESRLGPVQVHGGQGTFTSADCDDVFEATGCRVSYRARTQWGQGRHLTVSGPANMLQEAYNRASALIEESLSVPPPIESWGHLGAKGSAARLAASSSSRESHPGGEGLPWWEQSWSDEWGLFTPWSEMGWQWRQEGWSWHEQGWTCSEAEEVWVAGESGGCGGSEGGDRAIVAGPEEGAEGEVEAAPDQGDEPMLEAGPERSEAESVEEVTWVEEGPKRPRLALPAPASMVVHIHTLGCKQFTTNAVARTLAEMQELTSGWFGDLPEGQQLWLDATSIRHRQGFDPDPHHIGSSDANCQSLAGCTEIVPFVLEFRRFLEGAKQRLCEEVCVVVWCNWGKHRSVAEATVLYLLCKHTLELDVEPPTHHHRMKWSRKWCGHQPCESCDRLDSVAKMRALECVSHLYRNYPTGQ